MKKIAIMMICAAMGLYSCSSADNYYKGENVMNFASITRDPVTKAATLHINTDGKWKMYGGRTVESINRQKPVIVGEGSGKFAIDVPDSVRSYFWLRTERGDGLLAETVLPMEGGYNFRDLGGIRTSDGSYVKWGKLIRSAELHNLTDADLEYLASIPIVSDVDFRTEEEIKMAPDRMPSDTKYYRLSISPGNMDEGMIKTLLKFSVQQTDSMMMAINVSFVSDSAYVAKYRDFFRLLQNDVNIPLLFHCSAGKDRTGMAAALILYGLGADDETVMQNYLASNKYVKAAYAPYVEKFPNLKPLFEVKPEFLQAGLDRIRADHGTVENFLEKELNVDIHKFRDMYLYK